MASKVERTKPGSKNDWRITYDTGNQKWTDDRPGDGKGDSSGRLLQDKLREPSVQRGLTSIQNAIESGKGLQEAVSGLVRDIGTEESLTILSAIHQDSKGQTKDGWNVAKNMVKSKTAAVMDRVDPENLLTLWMENEEGEKFVPDMTGGYEPPPEGFNYQVFRDTSLNERVLKVVSEADVLACDHPEEYREVDHGFIDGYEGEMCNKCGGSRDREVGDDWSEWMASGSRTVMTGNMSWSDDLVLAIANTGVPLHKAIILAATACERCMNALAYEFGLDWGYPEMSEEWKKCGTECDYCRGMGYQKIPDSSVNSITSAFKDDINLKSEYDKYNRLYFGGKLPDIPLKWGRMKNYVGIATATVNRITGVYTPTGIKISTFMTMDEDRFKKTLLHEMIHVFFYIQNSNESHGPAFKSKAREIGSKAGVVIPLTDNTSGLQISDDIKATEYVAMLFGEGSPDKMMLFFRGTFEKERLNVESWVKRIFGFETSIGKMKSNFIAKFIQTSLPWLMKYKAVRKFNGIRYFPIGESKANEIESSGRLIGEIKSSDLIGDVSEKLNELKYFGQHVLIKIMKNMFGGRFYVESELYKGLPSVRVIPATSEADGIIRVVLDKTHNYVFVIMKNSNVSLSSKDFSELPNIDVVTRYLKSVEKQYGDVFHKAFGVEQEYMKTAGVRDVVERIFNVVRNKDNAMEMARRVVDFSKWHRKQDDLTPQEQRMLYDYVDFGKSDSLSKKKKLDIGWTDHAEYRSELRDVNPKQVNQEITNRLFEKLNPPERGDRRFKQPGLGTFVVDYDTTKNPAEAEVITVWAKEASMNLTREILSVAKELLESDDRFVTASEMDIYCGDCARQIREGSLQMTHGELREMLSGYRAERTADKWETLPDGWTDESRQKFWDSLTGDNKHKITKCMKEMDGKVSDTGAFCGALASKVGYR